jgi:hypothetical protein
VQHIADLDADAGGEEIEVDGRARRGGCGHGRHGRDEAVVGRGRDEGRGDEVGIEAVGRGPTGEGGEVYGRRIFRRGVG